MNDDTIADQEDAWIARALDQHPIAEATGAPRAASDAPDEPVDRAVDEYREVLSYLPLDDVRPPPALESRVVAAACAARAPAVPSIAVARSTRRRRLLLPSVAAAAVAAAVALVVLRPDPSSQPASVDAQVVSAPTPAELELLLDAPDALRADLVDPSGKAVGQGILGTDGHGYLYDLALPANRTGERLWLWLVRSGTPISAGSFAAESSSVGFEVDVPVDRILVTSERGGAVPGRPGPSTAEGELRPPR